MRDESDSAQQIALILRAAWSYVLDVDEPSDFFADGGESLDAAEIVALVSKRLRCEVPIAVLFSNPAFCDFVRVVRTVAASSRDIVGETAAGDAGTRSFQEQGLAQIGARVGLAGYDHIAEIRIPRALSVGASTALTREIGSRYAALRSAGLRYYSMSDRDPDQFDRSRESVAISEVARGEGLALELRSNQIHLDERSVDLLLSMVVALQREQKHLGPQNGSDYDDYVRRQHRRVTEDRERELLSRWQRRLKDIAAAGGNTISPDGDDRWSATSTVRVTCGISASALKSIAREWRVTPFSILLAAFVNAVGRVNKEEQFAICSGTMNRPPGFESSLGCFASADVFICAPGRSCALRAQAVRLLEEHEDARERADLPMDYALEQIGRPGCCQLKLTYRAKPLSTSRGTATRILRPQRLLARRDLGIEVFAGDPIVATASFRADRLASEVVTGLLDDWRESLRGLAL